MKLATVTDDVPHRPLVDIINDALLENPVKKPCTPDVIRHFKHAVYDYDFETVGTMIAQFEGILSQRTFLRSCFSDEAMIFVVFHRKKNVQRKNSIELARFFLQHGNMSLDNLEKEEILTAALHSVGVSALEVFPLLMQMGAKITAFTVEMMIVVASVEWEVGTWTENYEKIIDPIFHDIDFCMERPGGGSIRECLRFWPQSADAVRFYLFCVDKGYQKKNMLPST